LLEPVPVAALGRLAVDQRWHGCGPALLVHALDKQAKTFYLGHGFIESPIEPMTLMLSLAQTAV